MNLSYRTKLQTYLDPDWANVHQLAEAHRRLRNILLYGNRSGTGSPCLAKRLLKNLDNSVFEAYRKAYLDQDIQFDPVESQDFDENFNLLTRSDLLLTPEGWLETTVCDLAAPHMPYEILLPIRERLALQENAVEIVAGATLVYCFAAAGTK